jgi:hypothetical protein
MRNGNFIEQRVFVGAGQLSCLFGLDAPQGHKLLGCPGASLQHLLLRYLHCTVTAMLSSPSCIIV